MKSTGIIRKIDDLGRIVIPIEIRSKFEINEKDKVEVFTEGSNIILKKYESSCIFCGNSKKLVSYNNRIICSNCAKRIVDIAKEEKLKD